VPSSDDYPKPAIAVDIVLFCWDGASLSLPLVRRGSEPFRDSWAFPGGFLEMDETLRRAAERELEEETGLVAEHLVPGPIFDAVDRDPRGRVLSVPYVALVLREKVEARAGSDVADVRLFDLHELPEKLAFDHTLVLRVMRDVASGEVIRGSLGEWLSEEERHEALARLSAGNGGERGHGD